METKLSGIDKTVLEFSMEIPSAPFFNKTNGEQL